MTGRNTPYLLSCLAFVACSGGSEMRKNSSSSEGGTAGVGASAGSGTAGSAASAGSGGTGGDSTGGAGTAGSAGASGTSGTGGSSSSAGSSGAGPGGAGAGGQPSGGAGSGGGGTAGTLGGTPKEDTLPPLSSVRQEHSVVALAGEIYVIGGYNPNATASVQAYDPVARSWRAVRDFPQVLNHANAAVVGDRLFVTGFYVGSSMSNTSRQVFEYDPDQNQWTERTPMPSGTERATGCVAVLGNKIYVFGGGRGTTVTDASAYDTMLDEWQPLPALPESREHCAAGAIDGILYIAAGRAGSITGFRPKTLAYDPVSMTYAEKAPLPTPRGGIASAVLGGRLFVFGGEGNAAASSGVFPNIDAYEPSSNTWEALPPLEVPRHGYGAATLDGRIYLAGGATMQGFGAANDNSVFYFE